MPANSPAGESRRSLPWLRARTVLASKARSYLGNYCAGAPLSPALSLKGEGAVLPTDAAVSAGTDPVPSPFGAGRAARVRERELSARAFRERQLLLRPQFWSIRPLSPRPMDAIAGMARSYSGIPPLSRLSSALRPTGCRPMILRPQTPTLWVLLFSLKGSIIPAIWRKVLYTVLLSSLVVATHGTLYHYKVIITSTPFTLWGLTLAIFLGFRNNVAYQRFWEARTLWGELLIVTRNLARQTRSLLPTLDAQERRQLCNPLIAFSYTLRDQLRGNPPSDDAKRLLGDDAAALAASRSPTNALLASLGQRFAERGRASGASDVTLAAIDQQMTRLSYVLGGCERIRNTPIPYPYILMLHRIVHVYCFLLPFCLVDSIGWFTPLAVCVLAYTFFGLDALGDQIADPFDTQPNDLPLDAMSRNVEIAVLEILGETDLPEPLKPVDGLLL